METPDVKLTVEALIEFLMDVEEEHGGDLYIECSNGTVMWSREIRLIPRDKRGGGDEMYAVRFPR